MFRYYQECTRQNTHALPIFNKVKDRRLDLKGYVLNDGVCIAFSEAAKVAPELLTSIILQDNQFNDLRTSYFMQGMCHLTSMKQIIIKNNEVLDETI